MSNSWPERRRRHVVMLDAPVTRADGSVVQTTVSDLSLDGCRLTGTFRIGEQIVVKLPKIGDMSAVVRWAFLGRAGARFRRAEDEAAVG